MTHEHTLSSRPCTVDGVSYPKEPLSASYEPHEEEVLRGLMTAARALPEGDPERSRLINEVRTIHEMKAMLGGRILTDEERLAQDGQTVESATEQRAAMERLEKSLGVQFPKGVKEAVSVGQTSLIPPEGTHALPMPHEERLPSPDTNRIGKFQRPDDAAPTQRRAAILAYPQTGTARRRVLDFIASSEGVTDEEIQDALSMNPSTQRPRRVELVEDGWVCDSGRTRSTRSRTAAVVWVLTEQGREKWEVAA